MNKTIIVVLSLMEQRAESREQRAESREHGAESMGQRAWGMGQHAAEKMVLKNGEK